MTELLISQLELERSKVKILEQIITKFLPEINISDIYTINSSELYNSVLQPKNIKPELPPPPPVESVIEQQAVVASSNQHQLSFTENDVNDLIDSLGKIGTTIINQIPKITIAIDIASENMNISEYTTFTSNNIVRFNSTLMKRASINRKKMEEISSKLFTALEFRLSNHMEYTKKSLSAEDIFKIRRLLSNSTLINNSDYTPFSVDYTKLHNISLSMLSLSECIEMLYFNRKFKNLIYSPSTRTNETDPYNFYILKSIDEDNIKYWERDNRLVETANEFLNNIIPYCIQLFKTIYYDIFHDNTYRQNFTLLSNVAEIECRQLIKTIITLTNPKELRNVFITVTKKNATCFPDSETNKFNMTADDKVFAQTLKAEELDIGYIDSVFEQIFENITHAEIEKIITEFK